MGGSRHAARARTGFHSAGRRTKRRSVILSQNGISIVVVQRIAANIDVHVVLGLTRELIALLVQQVAELGPMSSSAPRD